MARDEPRTVNGMEAALPDPSASAVEFVGPFTRHEVVVNGWQVPLLHARPMPGGKVALILDGRMALDLSIEEAERVVPFIADAIAVSLGFTCHPRDGQGEPKRTNPLQPVRLTALDSVQTES